MTFEVKVLKLSSFLHRHKQVTTCTRTHTHTHTTSFLFNLLLFFKLILDLSWLQQSSSPFTYYQSASSLTFKEEEDKRGKSRTVGEEEERRLLQFFYGCSFGLSEKYCFCHRASNYSPDYRPSPRGFSCCNCWSHWGKTTSHFTLCVLPISGSTADTNSRVSSGLQFKLTFIGQHIL